MLQAGNEQGMPGIGRRPDQARLGERFGPVIDFDQSCNP